MILVIDNYDSFTYNLVQYLGSLACDVKVFRNDCITLDEMRQLRPEGIVLSPGPGRPDEAGISLAVVDAFAGKAAILGVCLGHQIIGQAFGGSVVPAKKLMHGMTSAISHDGLGMFRGIKNSFIATRYHSLAVAEENLPACLSVSARADDGSIMGLRHREYAIEGVQFHPESILTEYGLEMMANFAVMAQGRYR